jgi:cytochrome P450
MSAFCPHDPFRERRVRDGVLNNDFKGEVIPMILRHADVRDAAKDWEKFSSDAPFRVPIPSEEDVRGVRQLPIETDPPEHTDYRAVVEPFFRRALKPEVAARVERLMETSLADAMSRESIEIVREFALPVQSRALALLLNVPESEAEEWIGWGTHVFRDGDGEKKGAALENHIQSRLDRAEASPGDDFFSALTKAEFRGRPLTRDEMVGYVNLTFAGGRDTIIQSIAGIIAWFCDHPEGLEFLREDSKRIPVAVEEFTRAITPLTHIGRVCPVDTEVHGTMVRAGERISLCWASANFDEAVFDSPGEVRLDRRPNPHLAYGAGAHFCLGAHHARLIMRSLISALCKNAGRIDCLEARDHVEREAGYQRKSGYEALVVRFAGRNDAVSA